MSYNTQSIVRDQNTVPIPQFFDNSQNTYSPAFGHNGSPQFNLIPDNTGYFAYPLVYTSSAAESSNRIKNSAGCIYKVLVTNNLTSGGPFYFQLFNSTTAPTSGSTVPLISIEIIEGQQMPPLDLPMGFYFNTGIYFAISSIMTPYTSTSVTANYFVMAFGA